MGCTPEQVENCAYDEKAPLIVKLDGFYIAQYEVTQSQWEKVMGTSISQQRDKKCSDCGIQGSGPNYPMYYVNWTEAEEFCSRLSNMTARTYSLPTEAQWEYAARGGKFAKGTKYAGSDNIDAVAWHEDNSGDRTHVVGTKQANPLGIYDMSGNVWEWCKDWYDREYYFREDVNSWDNPKGPTSGTGKVLRGGGYAYDDFYCRVSCRSDTNPSARYGTLGFRVVCIP